MLILCAAAACSGALPTPLFCPLLTFLSSASFKPVASSYEAVTNRRVYGVVVSLTGLRDFDTLASHISWWINSRGGNPFALNDVRPHPPNLIRMLPKLRYNNRDSNLVPLQNDPISPSGLLHDTLRSPSISSNPS